MRERFAINYRKNDQCEPPVGFEVQVWVPSAAVVQVVLVDGGVLLETSIQPQHANAATMASVRMMLLMFRIPIGIHCNDCAMARDSFTAARERWPARHWAPEVARADRRSHLACSETSGPRLRLCSWCRAHYRLPAAN